MGERDGDSMKKESAHFCIGQGYRYNSHDTRLLIMRGVL
jgi:hypothetical protein